MEIVEAISRFRAGGYDERIGFTVYDTLRYKRALEELVKEEVQVLMDRLAGEMDPDRAVELIAAGAEPLNDLIAALHQKALVAELRRQRAARGCSEGDDGADALLALHRLEGVVDLSSATRLVTSDSRSRSPLM